MQTKQPFDESTLITRISTLINANKSANAFAEFRRIYESLGASVSFAWMFRNIYYYFR